MDDLLLPMTPYVYNGIVCSVRDGDTIHVDVDLGFGTWKRSENSEPGVLIRLLGCNARELEDAGGLEAKQNLEHILPAGTHVVLRTTKPDKFGGRYDAQVLLSDGTDLVQQLVAEQWVAAWDGKGTKPVPPWPRTVA